MSERKQEPERGIPKWVLGSIGLMLTSAVVLTYTQVGTQPPTIETFAQEAVDIAAQRQFVAVDQSDGTILISDAETGSVLEVVDRQSNGFIRGALRGLARERGMRGIGSGEPFRLRLFEDGTLVLDDPTTGQVVALNAFGQDNARAFAKYLLGDEERAGRSQGMNRTGEPS